MLSRIRRIPVQQETVQPTPATIPLYTIAGLAAILFPLCNVLSLQNVRIEIERESPPNTVAGLLFMLAFILLLPLVFVLYQELKAASQPFSAVVALFGILAPLGVFMGVTGLVNATIVLAMMGIGLSMWIGLAGYLAFSRRVLPMAWALFSLAIGIIAVLGAVLFVVISLGSSVSAFGDILDSLFGSGPGNSMFVLGVILAGLYILSIVIWTVWTGVLVLLRARRLASVV